MSNQWESSPLLTLTRGDLPAEQPPIFEMFINGKTAKTLGLTIPQSLPINADKVID